MAQNPLNTTVQNWLKEKWESGFLDSVLFQSKSNFNQNRLLAQFFNPETGMINLTRAKKFEDITGSGFYVPVRVAKANASWGPLEAALTASNPFTKEDEPTVIKGTLPTDVNWGFRHKIHFKDQELYQNSDAVAGTVIVKNKLTDFFGMFETFWQYFGYMIYRTSTTPLATIKSYDGTTTIDGTTYYKCTVHGHTVDTSACYIPTAAIQENLICDIYSAAVKDVDSCRLWPYSATEIISTTDLSGAVDGDTIWKEDTKGATTFNYWGDYVKKTGTVLNIPIEKYYGLQPTIIAYNKTVKVDADVRAGEAPPYEPVIIAYDAFLAKHRKPPKEIWISMHLDEAINRDSQARGRENLAYVQPNQSGMNRTLDLGVRMRSYFGTPVIPVLEMPSGNVRAIGDDDDGITSNKTFEVAQWGDKAIRPRLDAGGNMYIADQTNAYDVAHWFTLFNPIIWPQKCLDLTGIALEFETQA